MAAAMDGVSVDVSLDGSSLALSVQRDLVVRLAVPEGFHLYANPAPAGMIAVAVELDENPLLVVREVVYPPSTTHQLADTAEQFEVHHGMVELRLPVTINGAVTGDDGVRQVTIAGRVRWQACDDAVCELPASQQFELAVPVEGPVLPQIMVPAGRSTAEPRAAQHFAQMKERRR
ncbi:MAG: protein-disulfide reductase DsbD domain-containing protein [Pseudomonadales bacterium]